MKSRISPWIWVLILTFSLTGCQQATPTAVLFPTVADTMPAPSATTVPPTSAPSETPTIIPATPESTATEVSTTGEITSSLYLSQIHMIDRSHGMAIGGVGGNANLFLVTQDGGVTWTDMTPAVDNNATGVEGQTLAAGFYGSNRVWLMVSPDDLSNPENIRVMYSQDGGSTFLFSEPLDVTGLDESFYPGDIQFANENTGWLLVHVGAGMNHDYIAIYRTEDGGATWERLLDPTVPDNSGIHSCSKAGMIFLDQNRGYLTGSCNGVAPGVLFYKTEDGGTTWAKVTLPEPQQHSALFSAQDVVCGSQNPQVDADSVLHVTVSCRTYDTDPAKSEWYLYSQKPGSQDWTGQAYPGGAAWFMDARSAVCSSPDWQMTTDGGETWQMTGSQTATVQQIDLAEDGTLFALSQDEGVSQLFISTDQGKTWQKINSGLG